MHLNLINGAWSPGDQSAKNRNPSDLSDVIGLDAAGKAPDVVQAAEAAAKAQPDWFWQEPQARAGLAPVLRVDSFDEALSRENSSPFGLSAGICTGLLKYARAFPHRVKRGW